MLALAGLLVFVALVVAGGAFLLTSSATAGVYLATIGCLLAILARIAQAHGHHQVQQQALRMLAAAVSARTTSPPDLDTPSGDTTR